MDSPLNAVIELSALAILLMLACPTIMGAMMLLMWRSTRHDRHDDKA